MATAKTRAALKNQSDTTFPTGTEEIVAIEHREFNEDSDASALNIVDPAAQIIVSKVDFLKQISSIGGLGKLTTFDESIKADMQGVVPDLAQTGAWNFVKDPSVVDDEGLLNGLEFLFVANGDAIDFSNDFIVTSDVLVAGESYFFKASWEGVKFKVNITKPGDIDALKFNTDPPIITEAGTLQWNNKEYTIDINTGLGATIQVGQETLLLYYNDTGAQIDNFTALHPKSATIISGLVVPTPEKADASKWETCEGTLTVATHDIPNGQLGFATRFGKARSGNSTGWAPGIQLWLTADGSGLLTATKPQFPNYSISMGGSLKEHATEGEIFVSVTKAVGDTFNDAWDGATRETFNFTVTSNGAIVTGLLENVDPLDNLTLFFSDGAVFYTLDTTTVPLTIELTVGTDELTTTNYVYIPVDTKVLTVSTSGFPSAEHCKIAQLEVQSAATVQAESGAERNQNINDHVKTEDDNGHILHIATRLRKMNAEWDSGTEATLTGTPADSYIQVTGGAVYQLHEQSVDSFSMPARDIIITNDFTTQNRRTDNLNTIDAYSDGSSWNNEWGKIVVWGIANKTGETDFYKLNLPSAGYNSESSAVADASNFADYTIPKKYKGVGFLIASFTIRISGGTTTYNPGVGYQDLRGFIPNNVAGSGVGGGGVTTLLALNDVFATSYVGKKGYQLRVSDDELGTDLFVPGYEALTEVALAVNEALVLTGIVERQISVAAFSGTVDQLDEVVGLTAGQSVLLYAKAGHTITVTHNAAEPNAVQLIGGEDMVLDEINPLHLVSVSGGDVMQVNSLGAISTKLSKTLTDSQTINSNVAVVGETISFTATPTFDFDVKGNVKKMIITANVTTLTVANELPSGGYRVFLTEDGTGGHTLPTPDSSWGTELSNSAAFETGPDAANIIDLAVDPDGNKFFATNVKP